MDAAYRTKMRGAHLNSCQSLRPYFVPPQSDTSFAPSRAVAGALWRVGDQCPHFGAPLPNGWSSGVCARTGNNYDQVLLMWQCRWGAGCDASCRYDPRILFLRRHHLGQLRVAVVVGAHDLYTVRIEDVLDVGVQGRERLP